MARVGKICDRIIAYSFYLLFGLVPFAFTPFNFELFEFNKMWVVYILTIVIVASWLIKMVLRGEIKIVRTPLDIPILLFFASQIVSTLFSIDAHTSVWGYYSRFNGGLLSIASYILLYYAFVSNFANNSQMVRKILLISLVSGSLVAFYGVLEHFGIDAQYWVQDVKNRVFSSLGQPNWLAAYLSILIPIAIAFGLGNSKLQASNTKQYQNSNLKNSKRLKIGFLKNWNLFGIWNLLFVILFYITLLYTKSRSGFAGFWIGISVFIFAYFWTARKSLKNITLKNFIRSYWYILVVFVCIGSITFIVGSPFEQLNKYTLKGIRSPITNNQQSITSQGTSLETGGTESGEIRKIVWQGALDIARRYPLFGSGVETFAWAYYSARPAAHNLTSEWEFLYNKTHNEYLNYLATTGIFGLGTYLFMIGAFLLAILKKLKSSNYTLYPIPYTLMIALLAIYISILVSNFFGFSVVLINLYFFLIPAFVFVLEKSLESKNLFFYPIAKSNFLIAAILLVAYYLILNLALFWIADVNYAKGYNLNRSGQFENAYEHLISAVNKRSNEPTFQDELAINNAVLATHFYTQNDSTTSATLQDLAINISRGLTKKHPNNVSLWKSQARLFYTLSGIDEKYLTNTIVALEQARTLAPTDAKILYNLALLYAQQDSMELAIKTLEEGVALKPDYRDARYALGLFYDEQGKRTEAINQMDYIVSKIASGDAEATEKLLEWRGY